MGRERGSPDRREQVEIESLGSEMIQPPVIMHQNWLTCGPFRGKRPSSGTGNGFASEVWSKNRAKKTTCRDRASHHRQNDGGLHRSVQHCINASLDASHHRQNDGGLHHWISPVWRFWPHITAKTTADYTLQHLVCDLVGRPHITAKTTADYTTPCFGLRCFRLPHITAKTTADYTSRRHPHRPSTCASHHRQNDGGLHHILLLPSLK